MEKETIMSTQVFEASAVVTNVATAPPTTATPAVGAAAFIGAAQNKLSLGPSTSMPGMQTLQTALAQGPASHVPASVLAALQAYINTPQRTGTISDARVVVEVTIAQWNAGPTAAPVAAQIAPPKSPALPTTVHPGFGMPSKSVGIQSLGQAVSFAEPVQTANQRRSMQPFQTSLVILAAAFNRRIHATF
jgi:hypothetical protein